MANPKGPRRQFRVVNTGKGKLNITSNNLHEVVGDTEDEKSEELLSFNEVTEYRSDFNNPYVYSGYLFNGVPIIKRTVGNTEEFAQGVTDLETDWNNRLSLTYN